ncbi:sensor histidine kinase [Robiginitomaculum antarcticum]|uniref:sensor histidine kinase n=1 Tax=Robiginitomaculum antarcticum TaxID=437507 RepID=UPI0003807E77|nr:HAMP domain-containing sensor histidine kinase [Robiginitomaculum antarcticum]
MDDGSGNIANFTEFKDTQNVSEHDNLESSLADQDMFRLAMEHSAIGMALLNPSGQWLKVNQALCDIIGYSESELLSVTFQDISHPDDLTADMNNIKQLITADIQTYTMEKRYFHKDKRAIWTLQTVSVVRDENSKPKYFLSQIVDVTEAKKTSESLIQANNELQRLSYQISHDFRSPLNSSINMLEYLEEDIKYKRYDEVADISRGVAKSLKKLHKLATDIMSLNSMKITSENLRLVSVEKVVNDTLSFLGGVTNITNIHIRKDIRITGTVRIKKNHFALIVNNLISNSLKFRDPTEHTPLIIIAAYIENENLVFSVTDNGLGIGKPYHDRIFGMFERFHHMSEQGSGLGLYMVKQSADALDGTITYAPTPNGSCFKLRFPI